MGQALFLQRHLSGTKLWRPRASAAGAVRRLYAVGAARSPPRASNPPAPALRERGHQIPRHPRLPVASASQGTLARQAKTVRQQADPQTPRPARRAHNSWAPDQAWTYLAPSAGCAPRPAVEPRVALCEATFLIRATPPGRRGSRTRYGRCGGHPRGAGPPCAGEGLRGQGQGLQAQEAEGHEPRSIQPGRRQRPCAHGALACFAGNLCGADEEASAGRQMPSRPIAGANGAGASAEGARPASGGWCVRIAVQVYPCR